MPATKKKSSTKSAKTKTDKRKAAQHKGAEKRKSELPEKRKRQYKHIVESEKEEGRSTKSAKRIAMATVNKTRKSKGETKKKK